MSGNGDDESANESEIDYEIENWCISRAPVEMDAILGELELIQSGSRLDRAHRLVRRLRGDYTAADFARLEVAENIEEDENIRRGQVEAIVSIADLSQNAKGLIIARQQKKNAPLLNNESISDDPIANSTNNPNPSTSRDNVIPPTQQTPASTPNVITVVTCTSGTTTTTTNINSAGGSAILTTSTHGGITSTREAEGSQTLIMQLADGQLYEVRREVALEMARLKDAVHNIKIIANTQKSDTPEWDRLQQAVQTGNAASSTRLATPQNQPDASEIGRRNVIFQDTFGVRYIDAASNNTQIAAATEAQRAQPPAPPAPERGESGGGGTLGRIKRMIRLRVSALRIYLRQRC